MNEKSEAIDRSGDEPVGTAPLSDGHAVAHEIEEVVEVAASIEEEMLLEAAIIEDIEESW